MYSTVMMAEPSPVALPRPRAEQAIAELLHRSPHVWRGRGTAAAPAVATGFAALDRLLPGGGWPIGALTELCLAADGIGELRLLMPALRSLVQREGRPVVLVRPPHTPYAPALVNAGLPLRHLYWVHPATGDEAQWAAEQILRAGLAAAVLAWPCTRQRVPFRRLQLAAQDGKCLAFVYRSAQDLANPSPAAVRLLLHPAAGALRVDVVKARGGHGGTALCPLGRVP